MKDEIITKARALIRVYAEEIAEMMFAPAGHWFYVSPTGLSSLLTSSTRFNPGNFSPGEWVLVFTCTQDLDDVPAGTEAEAFHEWLITTLLYSDYLDTHIVYPRE